MEQPKTGAGFFYPVPRFRRRNDNGKNPDGQGMSSIFSRSLRKNTTHPLTVWIVGTDIERGIAFRNWIWYNFPQYKPINRELLVCLNAIELEVK